MSVDRFRWYGIGTAVAGQTAAVVMLGVGSAHADTAATEINGWTLQPASTGADVTLLDPDNALGSGLQVPGTWSDQPFNGLQDDTFFTANQSGPQISDVWLGPVEVAYIETFGTATATDPFPMPGATLGFLMPSSDGTEVVDIFNLDLGAIFNGNSGSGTDAPSLVNPDASGPITVGGLQLASPQDGALLNDLFDGDWSQAATLLGDLGL